MAPKFKGKGKGMKGGYGSKGKGVKGKSFGKGVKGKVDIHPRQAELQSRCINDSLRALDVDAALAVIASDPELSSFQCSLRGFDKLSLSEMFQLHLPRVDTAIHFAGQNKASKSQLELATASLQVMTKLGVHLPALAESEPTLAAESEPAETAETSPSTTFVGYIATRRWPIGTRLLYIIVVKNVEYFKVGTMLVAGHPGHRYTVAYVTLIVFSRQGDAESSTSTGTWKRPF